jgi:hypothetical protein
VDAFLKVAPVLRAASSEAVLASTT